jgi:hypothetical protein
MPPLGINVPSEALIRHLKKNLTHWTARLVEDKRYRNIFYNYNNLEII